MSVFGHGSLIYILQWRFSARSKLVVLWKWWPLFYRLQCLMTCNEKKLFFTLFIVTWGCLNVSESESHVCDFWAGRMIVVYKLKWGHNQCILRNTYTKIGTIQRRLAWPLRKDDTQIREAFHIFPTPLTFLWSLWACMRKIMFWNWGGRSTIETIAHTHISTHKDTAPVA